MKTNSFFQSNDLMLPVTDYLGDFIFSSVPAIAFGMLFNVPTKYLPLLALGGSIAHIARTILTTCFGVGIVGASFFASIIISIMFIIIAPRISVPRPVFTVASIVPIIPGKFAYLTLLSLIKLHDGGQSNDEYITSFFENGILTSFVLLAIGMGIAMPSLFFYKNRPVV